MSSSGVAHAACTSERTARRLRLFTTHGVIAAEPTGTATWPSLCAREAPRVGSQPDKACRLARDIAGEIFGHEAMANFIAAAGRNDAERNDAECNDTGRNDAERNDASPPPPTHRRARQDADAATLARHLAYQRYGQALSLIGGVLAEMDPARAQEQQRRLRAARADTPERIAARRHQPVSRQVTEPEPEPVVPCSLADLAPLLGHLRSNAEVERQTAFNKGTMTTDGRLDLCKQVVGPEGIGPLLGAMMHTDRVKRLLLGNNIVGDDGAAAIAGFLRERGDSPLDCWYIAGNRIGPPGLAHVCEALATDTRVTSLWLKRNPLKAAGMPAIAGLLRSNTKLQVLDLVNCGLLDAGLETVLGALMGPGANKTLRHLYLGTNGVSERSAPLIARFLAEDCALESLFLSCNRLGDEGVAEVARGLAANRTIRRVSLASNCVGPRGAAALAEALAGHPSIVLLDLGFTKATVAVGELGNFIGDDGARSLAEMLRTNTVLRSLDLLHNYISQVGVNHLREALRVNKTLVWLQLTQFGKVHNEIGKEELRAALQREPGVDGAADPGEKLWSLTRLAEIEERRGDAAAAEGAFEQALALGQADVYLMAAHADFLLDRKRPAEVLTLLKDRARADVLLLRLALAAKVIGDAKAPEYARELQARFDAARLRGDTSHRKEEARFALAVHGDVPLALKLARENWAEQREAADARVLLQAALAARDRSAAAPVLKWLTENRFEDVRLHPLADRIKALP